MIGIYAVINKHTRKAYVGSSSNINRRLSSHKSAIKTGKFYQKQCYAQDALKYGFDAFEFKVLCLTSTIEEARDIETEFLSMFINDNLYNLAPHANGSSGTKRNPKNYIEGAKKRLANPGYKEKLSNACRGKRKVVQCPHCHILGGGGNMYRYHFDKCKSKNERKP